jgi:hypothetical protein
MLFLRTPRGVKAHAAGKAGDAEQGEHSQPSRAQKKSTSRVLKLETWSK